MKIFKFGGASVKDADSVKNVVRVLKQVGYDQTLIVISAMGKTTNAMELVIKNYFEDKDALVASLRMVKDFHHDIMMELFDQDNSNEVFEAVGKLFTELEYFIDKNKSPHYNFVYDQIICFGELVSTTIVSYYLNHIGIDNNWLDVRGLVKTDSNYRDGNLDWELTEKNIVANVDQSALNITQGFLASDANNFTTTLGREGSDYTAGIFAYCLEAEGVTIWKDVPGVLNADPRVFDDTTLLNVISYTEAIELAFYGASVIHPKTLQPLQRKEIPLHVKSFVNPLEAGTTVQKGELIEPLVPCFIVKKDQVLVSLSTKDFSFIVEKNISDIFELLHTHRMKVDLIQNSAISFSVCADNKYRALEDIITKLQEKFEVTYHEGVTLYTVRHFDQAAIDKIAHIGKEVLLRQTTHDTIQFVVR